MLVTRSYLHCTLQLLQLSSPHSDSNGCHLVINTAGNTGIGRESVDGECMTMAVMTGGEENPTLSTGEVASDNQAA